MGYLHYSTIGALVPDLVKKIMPHAGRLFGVAQIDEETKKRVKNLQYPKHYSALYALWMTVLIGAGLAPLFVVPFWGFINFPEKGLFLFVLLGILNTIGALALFNGLIDAVFWQMSSPHFRDYVRFCQIKSGTGYVIEQQIAAMIKIGAIYYLVLLSVMFFLLR
ncbi:MAG: hypothetical protein A2787_05660 [Omnitrophica WOR_2 bacterium RIFCSPHIGHO2_01_FULL_48_9]|nr:MAG: hypothetical protein A2787_05660 [Omnitrophica WOR_2 bacterium RIFCSPHIGHO2_01_FULL_48_9]